MDYHTADFTSTLPVEHPYQPKTLIFLFSYLLACHSFYYPSNNSTCKTGPNWRISSQRSIQL